MGTDATLLPVLLIVLVLVFGLPLAIMAYNWIRRRRRRQLERSKRPIRINPAGGTGQEAASRDCPHRVSRSRARKASDGTMTSFCKWCERPMRRNGPGDWEVITAATIQEP
jgi:peptidoglycan/LPS O-acetylase OafA/YrhL